MRRTSLVTVQGKKTMSYAELIVLSDSQRKKLTLYAMGERLAGLEELRKNIDNLAKDLHVNWSIENNGNALICIERTTTDPIDDAKYHDLEIAAANFMSGIDKLELPKEEPECPSHESDGDEKVQDEESVKEEEKKAEQFIRKLLNDIDLPVEHEHHIIGAQILCTGPMEIPFPLPWGNMSRRLLKEMCELYLKEHTPIIVYP